MAFSLQYSPWLLLLCIVVAGGLTYWTYRDTVPVLSTTWRSVLGGLRFVALALLCFLLFEPVAREFDQIERPPVLAVLVDDSESLRLTSGADSADAAQASVRDAVDRLRQQGVDGEVRLFAFDRSLRPLDGTLDSLRLSGSRTDLAAALQSARESLQDANLKGVALLSDGQYNTGRNPLYVAERYPVPIHTVTLGDTTRERDVQIRRVTTNDIAYVDTELPFRVGLKSQDAGGRSVTVSLLRDGERLDRQTLTLPSGTAEVPVDLSAAPQEAGLQQFTVAVTEIEGEATTRNNTQSVMVRVLESKRRALLVGAAPSPDVAATRRLLSRNADIDLTARVSKQGGGFYDGALPDSLAAFDVLVLAGYPGPTARPGDIARIAEAAADVPTIFLLDRQTDLQALQGALSGALPMTLERRRSGFAEVSFQPAPSERQHPIFQVEDASLDLLTQLPPLYASNSRWAPTPDATVLATSRVRDVSVGDPLLIIRRRAGTRSAALLGAGTWRWSNVPSDLQAAAPLWPGLLSNLVRWSAARDDDRPVRIQPVASTFGGGETVSFTGQVYDESQSPVSDAAVEVTVTAPDSAQYPYTMDPVGNGQYELDIGTLPEGTYTYAATASRGGTTLGRDQGRFSVGALTLEYRETTANPALMRQIAERSGGTAHTPPTIDALLQDVQQAATFRPTVTEETTEAELWHASLFLAAILGLLAAEWALRKRLGLA